MSSPKTVSTFGAFAILWLKWLHELGPPDAKEKRLPSKPAKVIDQRSLASVSVIVRFHQFQTAQSIRHKHFLGVLQRAMHGPSCCLLVFFPSG